MNDSAKKPGEQAADYWGAFHTKKRPKLSWLESEPIIKYINKRITGHEDGNWCELFKKQNNLKFKKALIVGCGSGALERDLYKLGYFEHCIGIDISERSIEIALRIAEQEGLRNFTYKKFNLDCDDYLSLGEVDLVIVAMAAHHVENLEYFYNNIYKILNNNDGLLVLNEYIGPNRFWHNDKVVSIINTLLKNLDNKLKINHLVEDKTLRNEYIRTPIEHFLKYDPSEAIKSEEIIKKLRKKFNIINRKDYGGQINHMLLTGIIQNFENYELGPDILRLLMAFEELLENFGVIDSDFSFMIAKPKQKYFRFGYK